MGFDDWPEVRLGDLGRIVTGRTPSTSVADYFGGATPFVTPSDMDGRRIIASTHRYLSERGLEAVRNALVPEGSVMVSCIGSDMGKSAIAGKECVTNQQINSIVVDPAHCAEYIYYNLSARKAELQVLAAGGSAQPILNKGHFSQVTLPLPPLADQCRVASLLGSLDDKVELNHRMNRTLESIARAVFKSWFVDRDSMGANESIAAGDRSHDWSTAEFGDLAAIHQESVTPGEIKGDVVDHYSIPAFDEGKMPSVQSGSGIKSNKLAVRAGSVLVSRLNPRIPRVWLPRRETSRRGVCSTEFMVLSPKPPFTREYLYELLCSDAFHEEFSCRVTGTSGSHQRVKPFDALSIPVASPPRGLVECFSSLVGPLLEQVDMLREQSDSLANLRNAVLPRLLDGSVSSSHGPR